MASNTAYENIFTLVKNGYTGDSSIWDRTYDYLKQHPADLFRVVPPHKWAIGHQIVYNGGWKLLERIFELYTEDTMNISSLTKDVPNKTILDIARDRQRHFKEQYEYIESLFLQDKFLRACKEFNWPLIDDMLEKDKSLLNKKPPYYTKYFIHYIVDFGDPRRLSQYHSSDHPFQFDLRDSKKKTALELAEEQKNEAMIHEIKEALPAGRYSSTTAVINREKSIEKKEEPQTPSVVPDKVSSPIVPEKVSSPIVPEKVSPSVIPKKDPPRTIPKEVPPSPSITDQALKRFMCPLTKEIFVDPVVASDGCTYERKAILKYLSDNRCSPVTGDSIDATIKENTVLKKIIQDFRQQKLLPK